MQRTFFFLLILISANTVTIAQSISSTRIDLQLDNTPLNTAMRQVEAITPFRFIASAADIENAPAVTLNVKNESLALVLERMLKGTPLTFRQEGSNIFITRKSVMDSVHSPDKVSARNKTIHGTIRSGRTGETIIGATVSVVGTSIATFSNEYGFFSLTFPAQRQLLLISAVGMEPLQVSTDSIQSRLDVRLNERHDSLEAVEVTGTSRGLSLGSPQMSVERVTAEQVKNIPVIFGERDLLKTIQLLPGVKPAGEGNSGFYIRGGAADQNLILLDEAPVYNPSHLLGFFSTFNSDAIKNLTLYKGGMPPQYGGRLSSVVDIKMKDGNSEDLEVNGGIGLIASRLTVEGPLQRDKSSFMISGRRTYADLFLKLLGDSSLRTAQLYFYDLNAKANYQLGKADRLFVSGYFGRDVLRQKDIAGIDWGNATATIRWNHIFHDKLFSNLSLIYSKYDYRIGITSEASDFAIFSRIKDFNLKEELQWYAGTDHTITLGFNSIYHTVVPGEISVTSNNSTSNLGQPKRYSLDNSVYAGDVWKVRDQLSVAYGLRLSVFSVLGKGDYYQVDSDGNITDTMQYARGEVVKTYVNAEPRVAVSYQLNPSTALKASFTRNTQPLHLLTNSTSSSPTDKWIASTNVIRPGIADQVAIGFYKKMTGQYELSTEAYYKRMMHLVDYRNGANVFTNAPVETQLLPGTGRAYGLEFLFRKRSGRFNGWISYTLSKTERKTAGINNDEWYNARQDRTHDVAIVGIYELSKKWTVSANWVYYTGDAVTYPTGKYTLDGDVFFYYSERNGYRLPAYHRLDVAATVQLKQTKRFTSELVLSLFNAYGRANAYQVSFRESKDHPGQTEAVQTSLFTFVPSISYNFKF